MLRRCGLLVIFVSPLAQAQALFLTHNEWSRLSPQLQKKYIKELQGVFTEMDEQSPFFAAAKTKRNPATITSQSDSPYTTRQYLAAAARSLARAQQLFQKIKNSASSEDQQEAQAVLTEAIQNLGRARVALGDTFSSGERGQSYQRWLELMRQLEQIRGISVAGNNPRQGFFDAEVAKLKEMDRKFPHQNQQENLVDAPTRSYYYSRQLDRPPTASTTRASLPTAPATVIGTTTAVSAGTTAPTPLLSISAPDEFFACMYAGFVVTEDPCRAPSQLQESLKLTQLKKENWSCPSPQMICNPLIFGAKTTCSAEELKLSRENQPGSEPARKKCLDDFRSLCISPSRSATHDCKELSRQDPKTYEAAALLIQTHPEAWTQYTDHFSKLCDQEKIKSNRFTQQREDWVTEDVRKTCDWARQQLLKLREQFQLDLKKIDKAKVEAQKNQGQQ